MGEILLKVDCQLTYEAGKGIEVSWKQGGSLSDEFTRHLVQAGKEMSLALQHLAKIEAENASPKVRTKIEVEEA
ncbi:MAG: hypothetical protein AAC990_04475 [Dehalococcoides mccartyi]|uniref:Uncharacterized protein n=1 Tax=Dehalococcoides mccartyi TaxID=61435 RepID=A0AB38Z7X1_9CHLR|nr:hypothetical protein [Dehalococcoides mccartyi]WRO06679.1 hypothetical protein VLL09_04635 [Dehalococcoides mccartyi]